MNISSEFQPTHSLLTLAVVSIFCRANPTGKELQPATILSMFSRELVALSASVEE